MSCSLVKICNTVFITDVLELLNSSEDMQQLVHVYVRNSPVGLGLFSSKWQER